MGAQSDRLTYAVVCALLCACAAGCGGRAASPYAGLSPAAARELAAAAERARADELEEDLRGAFARRPIRDVLILSGGDADGAFGCGVLGGWRAAGRPTFDVVTGVSTGALMATLAFLGEARDDAVLRDVYTHLRDRDVMDGPFTPGPANSVFDTRPLRRLIARHVTAEVVARVAAAHVQGRRLYAATVELDSGSLVVWPLSKMAADAAADGRVNAAGAEKFRAVLLAAASIPVLFPPVEIDGGLHVDAGIREQIFLRRAMLGIGRAFDAARAAEGGGEARPGPPTVWAIVNGKLRGQPRAVRDDVVDIGVRSLSLYTESLQVFNLRDAAHLAAAHDPPFRFRWVAEGDEVGEAEAGGPFSPMFDPKAMGKLYEAGEAVGRSSDGWREGLPGVDGVGER